jgi:AcrR family transcriptional regulator
MLASRRRPPRWDNTCQLYCRDMAATDDASVADRTRAQILDAAHDCVVRFGIRRTSIQEVARFAGVSRGSVYRYFDDKPALVAAVLARSSDRHMAECRSIADTRSTLAERVAEVAVWTRQKAVGQLFFQLDETEPETLALMLTSQSTELVESWVDFWVPYVRDAQRVGEVRRGVVAERAAEWIARVLMGLVLGDAVTFDADDTKQLRSYIRTFAVAGLA